MRQTEEHPVATGLVALVAVAAVVGLVLGLMALVGSKVMGVGGEADTASDGNGGASLYIPPFKPTEGPSGPLVTLAPGDDSTDASDVETFPTASEPAQGKITLNVGKASVTPMENIDLQGVYPGGEGAILQVQRFEDGSWTDFPVTAAVSGGGFTTYVQTGRQGPQKWRMRDTDSDKVSNEVTVTVD